MVDKKTKILFLILFILIVASAVATYYRTVVIQDYPIINVPTP